jgi:hypothetical protein
MLLEKAIQFGAGLEPQQKSGLIGRERTGSISFDGQSLQSLSCWIGILGQVVGKLDGDLHDRRIAEKPSTS